MNYNFKGADPMDYKEKNMDLLLNALGNIDLTDAEKRSLEWLAGWEAETIQNICSAIEKTKNRGAGRKKKVDADLIKKMRSEGMTQEQVARELNISVSTVKRNEK
jgi:DNA-binding CsgD family transcriptional regulator